MLYLTITRIIIMSTNLLFILNTFFMFYTYILYFNYNMVIYLILFFFFFSSRRRHTRFKCDWSSDVCSSDLTAGVFDRSSCVRFHQRPKELIRIHPVRGIVRARVNTARLGMLRAKIAGDRKSVV